MQIGPNTVVTIDYTLTNGMGEVLDTSDGREPLAYLHGAGNIIRGLEKALDGKKTGDTFQVTIPPADAYGERDESQVAVVERSQFSDVEPLEPGMQFQVRTEHGPRVITIQKLAESEVTVDGNHPLAGTALTFAVQVRGVRVATNDEMAHGHVHGPGGHHH